MKNILIIEDDEEVRENIETLLIEEGYGVIASVNGEEGIRMTKENHPDLILCDIMMPGLNGYDVLRKLLMDPSVSNIPVVYLTAKVEKDDIEYGRQLGAAEYISKPFKAAELLSTIQILLGNVP